MRYLIKSSFYIYMFSVIKKGKFKRSQSYVIINEQVYIYICVCIDTNLLIIVKINVIEKL